jgi:hypothetical protein
MSLGNTVLQLFCKVCGVYNNSSKVKSTVFYFYISTCQRMCAVPNMDVSFSSLILCFPVMLLRYFLNDFEIVLVVPIISGISFVFTFHKHCISIVRSFYFRIFSSSIFIMFLSTEIATSVSIHVPFSLSWIMMFGLLLGDGSVSLHLLIPRYGYLAFLTCFYWLWYMLIPVFPPICWSVFGHTLYHIFLCIVLLPVLGMLTCCGQLSHQTVDIVCICYVSVCNIFVVWFIVTLGLVLSLFHF